MRKRWLALVVLGASTTAGLHSAADFLSESAARVVKSHLYECTIGSPGHGSTIDHHSVVLDFTCFLKPCPLHEDCTECYTLCTLLRHCKAATVFVSLDGQARGSFFFAVIGLSNERCPCCLRFSAACVLDVVATRRLPL